MNLEDFKPMDKVIWYKTRAGSCYASQMIPAEVYYRAKSKVAIKVMCPDGVNIKYVTPGQLQKVKKK